MYSRAGAHVLRGCLLIGQGGPGRRKSLRPMLIETLDKAGCGNLLALLLRQALENIGRGVEGV